MKSLYFMLLGESVFTTSYKEYKGYISEVEEYLRSNKLDYSDMVSLLSEEAYINKHIMMRELLDLLEDEKMEGLENEDENEDDVNLNHYFELYVWETSLRISIDGFIKDGVI